MNNQFDLNDSKLTRVLIEDEYFYKISNSDLLRPFFMSIVSDSNHWMFISSNGGLTAGRKNAEFSLFPYYTDDKITESVEITGPKSIFQVHDKHGFDLWEPFSERYDGMYEVSRNLYKNIYGNKIIFEEENHDLNLKYRYEWNSSNLFGFVKKSTIINTGKNARKISLLDGLQNILPYGVGSDLQNQSSNLVDAYKRSELDKATGLGIFALSAIIVDKAEPSEALKANIAWSVGLIPSRHLLSSLQLNSFRNGNPIKEETDVKAEKGAYFINAELNLDTQEEKEWMIIANVNQNHSAVAEIMQIIKENDHLKEAILKDIKLGTKRLIQYNTTSDGIQMTADHYRDARHFSNALFNIMRGGVFDHNYQIEMWDFEKYIQNANRKVYEKGEFKILTPVFTLKELKDLVHKSEDPDFKRLALEYLPLRFSRRHGDPSRPWNKFSINTQNELDGSKILDYEGNWRDIFQNWEALAYSFPEFIEGMIHKFLNASTFEGYNPYRVTKGGFDWETIEPDNPWSYIGYWGDHQIIYLLKFLEFIENHEPGKLASYFDKDIFVYANVPYKIKSYKEILVNPKDTIVFDHELDHKIRTERDRLGADGALLQDEDHEIYTVNLLEKLLATVLSKLSNFIPEGGIWMNTQRPEWNDANNALVGNGVSMVTLYYLRRFLKFFERILVDTDLERVKLSNELIVFYKKVRSTFEDYQNLLYEKINDEDRKKILDALGEAGSDYREHIYKQGFWGEKRSISLDGLRRFTKISLEFLEHSIRANKRVDKLYHAYNLMTPTKENGISISYLSEMLEGQVAVLSSGMLNSLEALDVLDGLKASRLFRDDQYSYLLYPFKNLPGFIDRNNIPNSYVDNSEFLSQLVLDENLEIIEKDINGVYHFNGNFKNAADLNEALVNLKNSKYSAWVEKEQEKVLEIFELIFNHKAFTGRSGTFYGYEGLGSIYWHMVSKLQLAVMECCVKAIREEASEEVIGRLLEHYYEINEGIGVHKPPSLYGAFPTDPYSHTPAGKGAQQPGMTGQVKEDILSRFGELGVFVEDGSLLFDPCLLRKDEFLKNEQDFKYIDVKGDEQNIGLDAGNLCFTYCQVPIIYQFSDNQSIEVLNRDKTETSIEGNKLSKNLSAEIFSRSGKISRILVSVKEDDLR